MRFGSSNSLNLKEVKAAETISTSLDLTRLSLNSFRTLSVNDLSRNLRFSYVTFFVFVMQPKANCWNGCCMWRSIFSNQSKETTAAYLIISTVFLLVLSYCSKAACTLFGFAITASDNPIAQSIANLVPEPIE